MPDAAARAEAALPCLPCLTCLPCLLRPACSCLGPPAPTRLAPQQPSFHLGKLRHGTVVPLARSEKQIVTHFSRAERPPAVTSCGLADQAGPAGPQLRPRTEVGVAAMLHAPSTVWGARLQVHSDSGRDRGPCVLLTVGGGPPRVPNLSSRRPRRASLLQLLAPSSLRPPHSLGLRSDAPLMPLRVTQSQPAGASVTSLKIPKATSHDVLLRPCHVTSSQSDVSHIHWLNRCSGDNATQGVTGHLGILPTPQGQ